MALPLLTGFPPPPLQAVSRQIERGLEKFDPSVRDRVVLVFSAHSVPMRVVHRGDQYPQEVAATVQAVMNKLGMRNRYILAWQSKGALPLRVCGTGCWGP